MPESDLVSRVAASTGLSPAEASRVIADVVAYFSETAAAFVRRRHGDLQGDGLRNPEIFAQISSELDQRVVAAPSLSERQLRRIVYG
ncbi:MAG: hypothetical protein WAK18_11385 [Nocardioidaceae bacterium]